MTLENYSNYDHIAPDINGNGDVDGEVDGDVDVDVLPLISEVFAKVICTRTRIMVREAIWKYDTIGKYVMFDKLCDLIKKLYSYDPYPNTP